MESNNTCWTPDLPGATPPDDERPRLRRPIVLLFVFVLLAGGSRTFGVQGRVSSLAEQHGIAWAEALGAFLTGDGPDGSSAAAETRDPQVFHPVSEEARRRFFRELPYGRLIREKADEHGVDPVLVVAIIENESGFRRHAVSSRGARGLMQLAPETGEWMGARDLHDPADNIEAGVRYLRYLSERFEGDLTTQLAAYNAGEGTVIRYGGVPPYRETREYVSRVLSSYERVADDLDRFGREFDARSRQGSDTEGPAVAGAG